MVTKLNCVTAAAVMLAMIPSLGHSRDTKFALADRENAFVTELLAEAGVRLVGHKEDDQLSIYGPLTDDLAFTLTQVGKLIGAVAVFTPADGDVPGVSVQTDGPDVVDFNEFVAMQAGTLSTEECSQVFALALCLDARRAGYDSVLDIPARVRGASRSALLEVLEDIAGASEAVHPVEQAPFADTVAIGEACECTEDSPGASPVVLTEEEHLKLLDLTAGTVNALINDGYFSGDVSKTIAEVHAAYRALCNGEVLF